MTGEVKYRKLRKAIGLTAITFSILFIYFIFFFPNPKIKIFNKTNYDIDSLSIEKKYFNIKKGDSLLIDNCKSFLMQGDLPCGLPQAKIKGKAADTFPLLMCGTGVMEIKSGMYQFDITISEDSSFYRLYWRRHY